MLWNLKFISILGAVESTDLSYGGDSLHDEICNQFKNTRHRYFDYKKSQSGIVPSLKVKRSLSKFSSYPSSKA